VNVEVPPGTRPLLLEDPSSIGGYHLLGRLGIGGMGVVYLAYDPSAGQMVAIKTLHPALADDPPSRLRFRAERDFGRRVSSFCIPRVVNDGMDGPRPYIVTEYIEGASLAQRVKSRGPLTGGTLEAVAMAVAAALMAIHAAGLAHRDLKPANVLLSPDGPRVIDFGIASDLDAAGGLTQSGVVMGSPGWIAPERLIGGPGSKASDVFGWGCLVAFAATGCPPFGSGTAEERTELILSDRPELRGLSEPWRGLVTLALAKDPEVRPSSDALLRALLTERGKPAGLQSAAETIAELWAVPEPAEQAAPQPRSSLPSPPPPPGHRSTTVAWVVTAAAVTIALAASIGGAANPDSPAGPGKSSTPRTERTSTPRTERTSTTPTEPDRTWTAPPDPAPSGGNRPVRTPARSAATTQPPPQTTSPAISVKVKKPKKVKAHGKKKK
jgi:eukaryotic-like serine/threonine-protein kinase